MKTFGITLLFLGVFCINALADDQVEQQKLFRYAVAHSPDCYTLPIDVPQSVIIRDGTVVVRDPVRLAQIRENLQMQNQLQNCFARLNNAVQRYDEQQDLSPTLTNKLKQAAMRFLSTLAATIQSNKNPIIVKDIANLGVRG